MPAFAGAGAFLPDSPQHFGGGLWGTAQSVTITGATGTSAAQIPAGAAWPLVIAATGTSGAGVNLPVGTGGEIFALYNLTTGVCKIYSVGATINGTTGTTAVSLTATGNKSVVGFCYGAGVWAVVFNT